MNLLITRSFNGVRLDCYRDSTSQSDDFWATREQIGRLLEYAEPMKSIAKIHERNNERLDKFSTIVKLTTVEGSRTVTRDVIVYNFKGLLEICRYSNQPKANAVMDFLWDIADEIRRTGSYATHSVNSEIKLSMTERVLRAAGIQDNQLAIALDNATQQLAGFSPLAISATTLEAPIKRHLLTPTQIGELLGKSARSINLLLAECGYQHKIGENWEPLPKGDDFAVMLDTGKKHSGGVPVRQLKWDSSILNTLETLIDAVDG